MQQNSLSSIHFLLVVGGFRGVYIKWDCSSRDDLRYVFSSYTSSLYMSLSVYVPFPFIFFLFYVSSVLYISFIIYISISFFLCIQYKYRPELAKSAILNWLFKLPNWGEDIINRTGGVRLVKKGGIASKKESINNSSLFKYWFFYIKYNIFLIYFILYIFYYII